MKKRLAGLILLVAIVVIALLWWRENRRYDGPVQQVTASAEQIARGRYLAQAADCAACHTASGGAPLAGGYPLDTPFGTIYGSNLTPSADHGIGRWSKDDFFLALTQGVAPGGRHLYPAMPYTSYKGISRQDADDIYAYLMTRPAVDVAIPANEMPFPFNQRMALIGWNLLFRSQDPLPASSQAARRNGSAAAIWPMCWATVVNATRHAARWGRWISASRCRAAILAASWRRTLRRMAWRSAAGRRRTSAASSAPALRRRVPPSVKCIWWWISAPVI